MPWYKLLTIIAVSFALGLIIRQPATTWVEDVKSYNYEIPLPKTTEQSITVLEDIKEQTQKLTDNCVNRAADEYDVVWLEVCNGLGFKTEDDCIMPMDKAMELDGQYRDKLNKCS